MKKFGLVVKLFFFFLLLVFLFFWLVLVVVGSIFVGLGYGFGIFLVVIFEVVGENRDFKFYYVFVVWFRVFCV